MAASLERNEGSIALFINGDLQFDSTDEHIYHEALALPALAVAAKRSQSPLKVLVIGGGDGLVAREMFKSSQVTSLDLVDYDPQILTLAQTDICDLNQGSLSDARTTIHIEDAWGFVDQALENGSLFDIIVSDLTVAEDATQARFHSVEWYAKLARLLTDDGVLAVNGVSPQETPQAYWSIFNSMAAAALHARPYHISLPSFAAKGYGQDWGFFLASRKQIGLQELDAELLAGPREYLLGTSELYRLFIFPEELFAFQPASLPFLAGSDILIHYFINSTALSASSGVIRDAFSLDTNSLFVPEPDTGKHILPPEICSALAKTIHSGQPCNSTEPEGVQLFLHEVLDLMPSLQREQTSALIAEFLEAPVVFLQGIDLPGLLARLLERAAELPSLLVAELKLLQESIGQWVDDQDNLLALGHRVITILILAIVVGNLLYPDAVYAKGAAGHASAGHAAGARAAAGARGARGARGGRGGYYGGGWGGGGGTYYYNNNRNLNPIKKGPYGIGPGQAAERSMNKSALPRVNDLSENIDESGNVFPARRYRMAQSPGAETSQPSNQVNAVYRLGPSADILADGQVAMPLTDSSYLLLTPAATHVIEQQSGNSVMSMGNDADLVSVTTAEIRRQLALLSRVSGQADSATENAVHYLGKADQLFKQVQAKKPSAAVARAVGAVGAAPIFPGVALTEDGRYLTINRANGEQAYLDGKNWYAQPGQPPLSEVYPEQFRAIAISYLGKMVRNATATTNMLTADKAELAAYLNMLNCELSNYETSTDSMVGFGTRKLPREEAIRLTQLAVHKTQRQIQALDKHMEQLPKNVEMAKIALANISGERNV